MYKLHGSWLPIIALLTLAACSPAPDQDAHLASASAGEADASAVELAYDQMSDIYSATEDREERVAIVKDFLARYPDSDMTANALEAASYPLLEELDRPGEAYELYETYLPGISDPETRFDAQKGLAILHSKTRNLASLDMLVTEMIEEHEFQFTDYLDLMEAAVEAEAWELASRQADASMVLANPEAFKAQWPDISDEDAESWGRRRQAYVAAYKGWALENLGQHDDALGAFAENAAKTTFSLLGVDDTPLHLYWGQSLLRQGRPEEAMGKLQLEALFGPSEALDAYRQAWIEVHGAEGGLDDHLWAMRRQHSKPMPQFTLANYAGETVDTVNIQDHVIVVTSWSPT